MKPTKLTPEEVAAEVQRRTVVFTAASFEEKRVLIAKDVIDQLNSSKISATTGEWVAASVEGLSYGGVSSMGPKGFEDLARYYPNSENKPVITELRDRPLREALLDETVNNCHACALGAMFLSCTLFNNKSTLKDLGEGGAARNLGEYIGGYKEVANGLTTFFSMEQLKLIEYAYEGGFGAFTLYVIEDNDEFNEAGQKVRSNYFEVYPDAHERLIAIMQNIIDNKGTFVYKTFPLVEEVW